MIFSIKLFRVFGHLGKWRLLSYSEHRELYSNMGMRIEYTIFLMMRLKSFRPEVDTSWQSRRECQK